MEGDIALTPCLKDGGKSVCAKNSGKCAVKKIMSKLNIEICKILAKVRIV